MLASGQVIGVDKWIVKGTPGHTRTGFGRGREEQKSGDWKLWQDIHFGHILKTYMYRQRVTTHTGKSNVTSIWKGQRNKVNHYIHQLYEYYIYLSLDYSIYSPHNKRKGNFIRNMIHWLLPIVKMMPMPWQRAVLDERLLGLQTINYEVLRQKWQRFISSHLNL